MRIVVYHKDETVAAGNLRPQDGKLQRQLLGVDIISFSTATAAPADFQLGDFIVFEGTRYTLNLLPAVKKYSRQRYEYALTFEAPQYALRNAIFLFDSGALQGTGVLFEDARNGMADFSFVGTPADFLALVAANASRIAGDSAWQAGSAVEADARELYFASENCLGVLQKVAQEFGTEFWFEGRTIHLTRKAGELPYNFEYGKGHTLYDIERTMRDTGVVTRLYAYGSERNLPAGYRATRLALPEGTPCVEQNTDLYGIVEQVATFDDVYPHRTGTVSGVDSDTRLVFDADMPFDLNSSLLPGVRAKMHFNTGNLAGYEFEIAAYDHSAHRFTIIPVSEKFGNTATGESSESTLPNATLKPKTGDTYVLLDIALPPEYVAAAENELLQKALQQLAENATPKADYRVTPNEIMFTQNRLSLVLGASVHLVDSTLGIDRQIRIVGFEQYLDNPFRYDNVQLADVPTNSVAAQKFADYTVRKSISSAARTAAVANKRAATTEDVIKRVISYINDNSGGGEILTTPMP